MAAIEHREVSASGMRLHVARAGEGPLLPLLHGWPELRLTRGPITARLAGRFDRIAPDLRGFGRSEEPAGGWLSDRAGAEGRA